MAGLKARNIISEENEWRAEDDLRTLVRAIEIKKDAKRYAAAKAIAKKREAELNAIMGSDKD